MLGRPPIPTRPQFVAALRRNAALKEAAAEARISVSCASKWASACGYRRMFVTDAERRQILQQRKNERIP